MAESRNHGTAEITPNPKRWNRGMAERRKIPRNPKRRNDGKGPEILKDGMTESARNPKKRNDGKCPEILKDGMTENAPKS